MSFRMDQTARKVSALVVAAALSLIAPALASAQQIRIVTDDLPPFSLNGERKGFVLEATIEAVKRAGFEPVVEFVPWRRAQTIAQEESNVVIIPLSLSKDREPNYTWIAKIVPSPYGFITLKEPAISNIEALKAGSVIGVSRGTVYEDIISKNLNGNELSTVRPEQNAQKLNSGRIDAWFDGYFYAAYYYNKMFPGAPLVFGKPMGITQGYVAAGKNFPKDQAEKIRVAVESVISDGTFDTIRNGYVQGVRWPE